MKTYTLSSPSLDGVLSDDHLYFEGIRKPSQFYTIRDGGIPTEDDFDLLEKYFNDVYNLFLRKLSAFATYEFLGNEESLKLQALLQELIKVKELIRDRSSRGEKL